MKSFAPPEVNGAFRKFFRNCSSVFLPGMLPQGCVRVSGRVTPAPIPVL